MTAHNRVFTIGSLAEGTGCSSPTIRYYEGIGLLPKATRRPNGQRTYTDEDFRRLTFIRRCREFGFPIDQVRRLVELAASPERDCVEARDVAQLRLDEVRSKLEELRVLERSLVDFVATCESQCAGGPGAKCVVLVDLAGPARCCG
jgi:MerR family transcriptional regulator, copper efflux regulator